MVAESDSFAGQLTLTKDDSRDFQSSQVVAYDTAIDVYHHTPYGMSYVAPVGSYGHIQSMETTESRIALFGLPQLRFKNLKPGELQLGNYLTRSSIKFDKDKNIIVDSKNDLTINVVGDIDINCTNLNIICSGKITVTATEIDFGSTTMKHGGKVIDSTHTHPILSGSSAPGPTGSVS